MWRFLLALKCFFLVLFARRLPPEAAELLPAPRPEQLGAAEPPRALPQPQPGTSERPPPVEAKARATDAAALQQRGAILLLGVLQREGRLLDFLQEEVD